jgi:hypothetical protein
MKGRVVALSAGLGLASITAAHGQQVNKYGNPFKHPAKPTTAAITAEELRTRLYIFSDDSMRGRQVAHLGNYKGTSYIASELKRFGVEPGGDNGSYFQRLPYVMRHFTNASLTVNGAALTPNTDFVAVPGATAPRAIANVAVIYGGVEGDTAREITPAQAAGKFVIMSPGDAGAGGGSNRGGGNGGAGAIAALPAACTAPAGGRGGRGGAAGGGRGGAGGAGAVRFPDAAGIAIVDLSPMIIRQCVTDPAATAAGGGRGGAGDPTLLAAAAVATPNPAFKGVAGDLVVTNGNSIAIVRNGALVAGTLPSGTTAAMVVARHQADSATSADSARTAVDRTDTLRAAARSALEANQFMANASFRGTVTRLDSTQVLALGCAAVGGGRGAGAGGRGGGRGAGGRGAGAAVETGPPAAEFHISRAAAAKLLGADIGGAQPGATGGMVTARLGWVQEPSDWARNVVGIVRGSDPKLAGEFVAIGAHNDHNGIRGMEDHDSAKAYRDARIKLEMQVVKGDLRSLTEAQSATIHVNMDSIRKLFPTPRLDSIQNGADDDGSGSMGVLEIAEAVALMPVKPKRSIIFVWHTGEEAGLLGSTYFTANPTVPIDSIVTQINIDMIGRGRAEDMVGGGPTYVGAVGSKRLSADLNHEMLAVNAAEPAAKRLRIDYRFDDPTLGLSVDGRPVSWPGYNNIYGRSDHANYANKCIPIVFFFTGLHGDYHQNTDEPQYIDYPHYALIDSYIRDLLVDVANRPVRPALDKVCSRR